MRWTFLTPKEGAELCRLVVIPVDFDREGQLHHVLLAFQHVRRAEDAPLGAKEALSLYYEQLKQSILENDSYVDAMLDMADCIYMVDLTHDRAGKGYRASGEGGSTCTPLYGIFAAMRVSGLLRSHMMQITRQTQGCYRTAMSVTDLLKRFEAGDRQFSAEYEVREKMVRSAGS